MSGNWGVPCFIGYPRGIACPVHYSHFTPGATHLLLLSALKFSHCDGMQWYLLRNSFALLWSIRCFGDYLSPMSDANELHTHINQSSCQELTTGTAVDGSNGHPSQVAQINAAWLIQPLVCWNNSAYISVLRLTPLQGHYQSRWRGTIRGLNVSSFLFFRNSEVLMLYVDCFHFVPSWKQTGFGYPWCVLWLDGWVKWRGVSCVIYNPVTRGYPPEWLPDQWLTILPLPPPLPSSLTTFPHVTASQRIAHLSWDPTVEAVLSYHSYFRSNWSA
jgi:hypothetical protein